MRPDSDMQNDITAADVANTLAERLPRLYAVLDAARWGAREWLRRAGLPHQCLFDGQKAIELADEAPYLVHLGGERRWLEQLCAETWGQAGGIYLVSDRPFYDVRRLLRRFLLVEDLNGDVVYFRYYDPRVAAPFLPTLDSAQIATVYGQVVDAYIYEDEETGSLDEARVSPADTIAVTSLLAPPRGR